MRSHYSSARVYRAPEERRIKVKHSFDLRARSWTIGNISAAKKEKKQQRGQMFAQPTSVQVFPLAPRWCARGGAFVRLLSVRAKKLQRDGQPLGGKKKSISTCCPNLESNFDLLPKFVYQGTNNFSDEYANRKKTK